MKDKSNIQFVCVLILVICNIYLVLKSSENRNEVKTDQFTKKIDSLKVVNVILKKEVNQSRLETMSLLKSYANLVNINKPNENELSKKINAIPIDSLYREFKRRYPD